MPRGRFWTDVEDRFIIDNLGSLTVKEIAEGLQGINGNCRSFLSVVKRISILSARVVLGGTRKKVARRSDAGEERGFSAARVLHPKKQAKRGSFAGSSVTAQRKPREETPPLAVLREPDPDCVHHWMIESPSGPTSIGICRFCGGSKEFRNHIVVTQWTTADSYRMITGRPPND